MAAVTRSAVLCRPEWISARQPARAAGSSGGTRHASASETASSTPPTRVATMGTPAAMASNTTMGVPSERDLRTQRSKARKKLARHRHHGLKPAQQAKLNCLVQLRSPAHPARAMNRGHRRDTHAAGDAGIQQICPIPMGVHDVRPAKLEEPTHLPPLPEVRPMGNQDGMHRYSPCPEGANDGIA